MEQDLMLKLVTQTGVEFLCDEARDQVLHTLVEEYMMELHDKLEPHGRSEVRRQVQGDRLEEEGDRSGPF